MILKEKQRDIMTNVKWVLTYNINGESRQDKYLHKKSAIEAYFEKLLIPHWEADISELKLYRNDEDYTKALKEFLND
jgi:hypothetical protein